ncbi:MAG: hypothetical protein AAGN46_14995 [Acidobacteriota bacterium]
MSSPAGHRAYTLIEALGVLALLGMSAALALPPLRTAAAGLRVELAAQQVAGALAESRLYAIRHRANVGVKFHVDGQGEVDFALYRDGDGDGVRNADLEEGVDPLVRPWRRLGGFGDSARFGFPPGLVPKDPGGSGRRLDRLDDPIRFNRSDLAVFSPVGTATPGSVYLTDGGRHLWVVRVASRSGKITRLVYDLDADAWRRP